MIELLVVVSIIGILAAMLLPVLGHAKGMAVLGQCSNRQRQLYLGYMLYESDHDHWFPFSTDRQRSPCVGWGTSPRGLEDYDLIPFNGWATADQSRNSFLCPAEGGLQHWGAGYHLIVGWPGGKFGSQWPQLGKSNPACAAGGEPWLFPNRCTIRIERDIGDTGKDQAFFNCPTENFDYYNTPNIAPKYGSHFFTAWGVYRGNTAWSDGHITTYRSTDITHVQRTYNGSFNEFW